MWIIAFIFFGPLIYLMVSAAVDSVSDKVNAIKRKKYHGEEVLAFFSTHEKDNISKEDILLLFDSQFKKYRQQYYNIEYKIFNGKEEQNCAWSIKTTKKSFGWGIIYNIQFRFSNGWVYLSFSNCRFSSGNEVSLEYYLYGRDFGTAFIESTLGTCRDEAIIMWKMNGIESTGNLPFDYIPLSGNNGSSQAGEKTKKQREKSSHCNPSIQSDLLTFYRNLLGLKLCFSHDELKKSYREAVEKYHPDRYGTSSLRDRENAEMLMKQVNEAYEKLKKIAG